jgi:RNase P subunit RPR2
MSSNFWRFASTLEKEFHVPYDRDKETILCPECQRLIRGVEQNFKDYTSRTEDDYIVYSCPYCGRVLTCRAVEA